MARNDLQPSDLEQCITRRNKIIMETRDNKKEIVGQHQERENNQQEVDSVPQESRNKRKLTRSWTRIN